MERHSRATHFVFIKKIQDRLFTKTAFHQDLWNPLPAYTVCVFKHTKTQKALLAEKNHKDTLGKECKLFSLMDETF